VRPTQAALPRADRPIIRVEFIVLHYTVEDLDETLRLFSGPDARVSAHLVIAPGGDVYETVPCWDGVAYRADHAGLSRWSNAWGNWEGFNAHSVGIEIVNRNGNLFPFTDAQYDSLATCLRHLQAAYPSLTSPDRVLGHEHIAGWRGKVDPGTRFDWLRLFQAVYPGVPHPSRPPTCPKALRDALGVFVDAEPSQPEDVGRYWRAVNAYTEASVAALASAPDRTSG
jgi:N-acetylmuramoyl-L-alanine amidase